LHDHILDMATFAEQAPNRLCSVGNAGANLSTVLGC